MLNEYEILKRIYAFALQNIEEPEYEYTEECYDKAAKYEPLDCIKYYDSEDEVRKIEYYKGNHFCMSSIELLRDGKVVKDIGVWFPRRSDEAYYLRIDSPEEKELHFYFFSDDYLNVVKEKVIDYSSDISLKIWASLFRLKDGEKQPDSE